MIKSDFIFKVMTVKESSRDWHVLRVFYVVRYVGFGDPLQYNKLEESFN